MDFGQLQHIVDNRVDQLAVKHQAVGECREIFLVLVAGVFQYHLGIFGHGLQGGLHLVAHIVDEIGLEIVGPARLVPGLLKPGAGLHELAALFAQLPVGHLQACGHYGLAAVEADEEEYEGSEGKEQPGADDCDCAPHLFAGLLFLFLQAQVFQLYLIDIIHHLQLAVSLELTAVEFLLKHPGIRGICLEESLLVACGGGGPDIHLHHQQTAAFEIRAVDAAADQVEGLAVVFMIEMMVDRWQGSRRVSGGGAWGRPGQSHGFFVILFLLRWVEGLVVFQQARVDDVAVRVVAAVFPADFEIAPVEGVNRVEKAVACLYGQCVLADFGVYHRCPDVIHILEGIIFPGGVLDKLPEAVEVVGEQVAFRQLREVEAYGVQCDDAVVELLGRSG